MLQSSVKQLFPKFNYSSGFSQQLERRAQIKMVCHKLKASGGRREDISVDAFLVSQMPASVVCYNHKVASTTWISTFVQLLGDPVYFQQLSRSGAFYK